MQKANLAIGVFDSGMGGLTILRALQDALPQESFIYLGDTARLPYGTKSQATVQQYAVQMARILVERNIKALVIACNTATTAALEHLKDLMPDLPIIGVVQPGASAAVAATKNHKIMVLATETTIASNAYQQLITAKLPQAAITSRACSLLVALAEEGLVDEAVTVEALKHYLSEYSGEDTILLGCTHFLVFKKALLQLLPKGVQIVDSSEATAEVLKKLLTDSNILNITQSYSVKYLVTDSIQRFRQIGSIFLNQTLARENVELIDA
jgi:glutamate racemase